MWARLGSGPLVSPKKEKLELLLSRAVSFVLSSLGGIRRAHSLLVRLLY
jgi:hypothetical protein